MKRAWAIPLNPVYRSVLAAKNALYQRGVLPVQRLQRPVISVGSLSAGGAGKTPVVRALAHLLQQHGIAVDVLSRGYGRRLRSTLRVARSGDAEQFGDEPLELARSGIDVFVGADRFCAGVLAEETNPAAALHLLDDGFQHRRLGRALDIVLLTLEDVNDNLLPAGNLREPLASLERAGVVIVRREEAEALGGTIRQHTNVPVWQIERTLELPGTIGLRPFVFCAISRPDGLLRMLEAAGIEPSGVFLRRDHHRWTDKDVGDIIKRAQQVGSTAFLTTEKDAVKLSADAFKRLAAPVVCAQLRVAFLDPQRTLDSIQNAMQGSSKASSLEGA